uniref:Alternative protein PLBD2 n=1 Tax=Homo sapiens TaxID=9606 RepID=L8EBF9_HUMAN|nr:alternative protein PLBD2 [Homo sapiens]
MTSSMTLCHCAKPATPSPMGRMLSPPAPTSTRPMAPTPSRPCVSAPMGVSM